MVTYKYARPAMATDIIIFTIVNNRLSILLVNRGIEPFKGALALPGGFVRMEETLMACAQRELTEEAGLSTQHIKAFGVFDGVGRDPRDRVISVGFYAIIPCADIQLIAGSDAEKADWYDFETLSELAFDHNTIVEQAYQALTVDLDNSALATSFLPPLFTLAEFQQVFEIILGKSLDKRNFRKWISSLDYIVKTDSKKSGGQHRPAALYQISKDYSTTNTLQPITLPSQQSEPASNAQQYQSGYDQGFKAALRSVNGFIASL